MLEEMVVDEEGVEVVALLAMEAAVVKEMAMEAAEMELMVVVVRRGWGPWTDVVMKLS